jgi:hypothetical protein
MVMIIGAPKTTGNFLTSLASAGFSKGTLPHDVIWFIKF